MTAHVEEQTAVLAKVNIFDLKLVIFITCATLVHEGAEILKRGIDFIEFQRYPTDKCADCANDN